ncbi:MAG: MarR family transcriptional regulator [Bacillaceae bacterium]|uniref:MarR family winged helix-turn-helix transcriptional regulator n=1 Tax=Aeribacillus TaxID=1055323 RepID=UPI000E37A935|nr:MarR family transcriptional regulator [Aeribacillus pallidus]REJ20562.1 MAG: MarR family transcriptional regulator [Bacillaceae bacterium]RZI51764.1 MarR family transcriptional regulator [Aeribacillus pallidus]
MNPTSSSMTELENEFIRIFRDLRNFYTMGKKYGLSRNEFFIMKFLLKNGPQKLSTISQESDISPSFLTGITDQLIEKGYIERNRSKKDRRIVHISLTKKGEETIIAVQQDLIQYMRSKFNAFTEEEIQDLIRLLRKIP